MAFNFAHTVGTGYYYSSFHYLGYSPFSAAHDGDVKPDIACPWVSEYPLMSASALSCSNPTRRTPWLSTWPCGAASSRR